MKSTDLQEIVSIHMWIPQLKFRNGYQWVRIIWTMIVLRDL
jgi:hypothetical protein